MAELTYRNLELVGGPEWDNDAVAFCRELQKNLSVEPMEQFILEEMIDLCLAETRRGATARDAVTLADQLHLRRLMSTGPGTRRPCG